MESIKYEITEQDIKKYLSVHGKDELIKFKEALFVKYIKHQDIFSIEKLEMLLNKDKSSKSYVDIKGIYGYGTNYGIVDYSINNFENFLKVQTLDTSAYLHILIPTLASYRDKLLEMKLTNGNVEEFLPCELNDYDCGMLSDTIENYHIAGIIKDTKDTSVADIYLTETECWDELREYSKIYGKDTIEKIDKKVKVKINKKG